MSAVARTTLVIGLSDAGSKDQEIGLCVMQALKQTTLPEHVEVLEGPASSDLAGLFAGRQQVIVVDAANFKGLPGTFVELTAEDLLADHVNLLHQTEIRRAMAILYLHHNVPKDLVVIGVIAAATDTGSELTVEVKSQVPAIVNAIREKITNSRS